jgi:hypothetical protein
MTNVTDFLQEKAKWESKRHATALERLELERKREDRAERELQLKQESAKVETAKQILCMDGDDEDVKAAAKKFLLNLFT